MKSVNSECKIVLYDYRESVNYLVAFFWEHIDAYLTGNFDEGDLRDRLAAIGFDRVYINTELVVELIMRKPRRRTKRAVRLAPTEVKMARLLITGMRPSIIAQEMDRKPSTISTIKSNIFRKTNVDNIIDLMGAMDGAQVALRV
ncbi:regulatory protein, luxR family [Dyadobacter sp. SG02]|uniref:LuxR C-terminal-related transcriptional regulator n=1 Tax=Dyadobacter sp. SG02 TaxID=1855291 RepID=UPI0008B65E6F|nr:LuxR C-terminal-related transcriptional regulator [Dyadobacter sp. SG02]SEJ85491.1 regulatory protein, luxR family [Dyadobacter sp. SG02]